MMISSNTAWSAELVLSNASTASVTGISFFIREVILKSKMVWVCCVQHERLIMLIFMMWL